MRITVTDESYEMPGGLESEAVSLTLQNEGKQVHRAYFARFNQGVKEKDVRSALTKSPDALFPLITLGGSMPEVEAGATSNIGMLFPEGDYIVIDPEVKGPPPFGFFEVSALTQWKPETSTSRFQIPLRVRQPSRSQTSASKATKLALAGMDLRVKGRR
jgi:hypothetical protein